MKLDKLTLVNWGQLPPGDYEFSNMTLLTGPTGAGKSTMLDALQTVMTAAFPGIVAYNPGQDEVQAGQRRGKSKRTLESFVCGAEYSLFSRPEGAHGYIAAVFRPDPGEDLAKPFTALVAAAARVDGTGDRRSARLERLELVIVDDDALCMDDFLKDAESHEWIAVEDIVRRLKAKYRKVIHFDSRKKDYLCALYGHFRGRPSINWDETQNAARAWSQSIAYKPIGSVHDLVRDDILEFDGKQLQESIARISDLMRQVSNLKEEGVRIGKTVEQLHGLKQAITNTTSAFEDQVSNDLLGAKMHLRDDEERVVELHQVIARDEDVIKRSEERLRAEKALWTSIDTSRVEIAARLAGVEAHGTKTRLQEKLADAGVKAKRTLDSLLNNLLQANRLDHAARALLKTAVPETFSRLRKSVDTLVNAFAATEMDRLRQLHSAVLDASADKEHVPEKLLKLAEAFKGANKGLETLLESLVGPVESVSTSIVAEQTSLDERVKSEQRTLQDLTSRKELLIDGRGNYGRDVSNPVDRIRELFPEAAVQVLCDLIEPKSEEWQEAIEGYFDNARFNLIVTPEWESKTIDFLKNSNSRLKVIQGKRCLERADASRVPSDSIIHELSTDHPIAAAYLIEQYGSVIKVSNSEQLRMTARGLTKDGKGSGSRTMFAVEKRALVFGRVARERALAEAIAEIVTVESSLARLTELRAVLEQTRTNLSNLREPSFDAEPLREAGGEIENARRSLEQLDLTEVHELEARLEEIKKTLEAHAEMARAAETQINQATTRIEDATTAAKGIEDRRGERLKDLEQQIGRLKRLCEANTSRTYTVMSEAVNDLLQSRVLSAADVVRRRDEWRVLPTQRLGDVRELLAIYNGSAKSEERFQSELPHLGDNQDFEPCYGPLIALGLSVGNLYTELEGLGLYNNRDEVENAERSFRDVFTKQFCVEIKTKVDDGVRTLRQLNIELQNLKFGTDKFSIDWSKWEPAFEEYYGFFNAVTELADSPETVDLFGEAELLPKQIQVRDRLVTLLLDKDQERARGELLRIADYRNYRRYEIWNESDSGGRIALSTWGTGSGGQLETPAYIVRAAVVTNRMKLFDKGASLKLLVSDESFSKMDETRAKAVLKYLRDGLGLQLVSAMPTRNAGALRPEFEREYSYSRMHVDANGELDFILEPDERVFRQDKMRALWELQRLQSREQARLEFDKKEPLEQNDSGAGES